MFRLSYPVAIANLALAIAIAASNGAQAQQPVQVRPVAAAMPAETLPPGQPNRAHGPADALTLDVLEGMALQYNPSLARAQAVAAAARGNWLQVGLKPNPAIGYAGYQLGSGGVAEQNGVLFEQEIVPHRKLALNRQIANHEIDQREREIAMQEQRVLTDVRIAFYEALLAQRSLDLAGQFFSVAEQGQQAAQKLQRAGEGTKVDALQANIEVYNAEIELNVARNRHQAAWQRLTAVVGVPQLVSSGLCGELEQPPPDLNWDQSLAFLLASSPEVGAAAANAERAGAALARARAEPLPNLRFQGGVVQDQAIGGKTNGIVQLLVPLPIHNRNQGAIRQAESELIAAQLAVQQVQLDLQNRLAPVFERFSNAASQVRRYRQQILPDAEESLRLVRRGYEAGEFPFLNLLNAQRTYFQTNLRFLNSLRDLRLATIEIEGLLLQDSLATR